MGTTQNGTSVIVGLCAAAVVVVWLTANRLREQKAKKSVRQQGGGEAFPPGARVQYVQADARQMREETMNIEKPITAPAAGGPQRVQEQRMSEADRVLFEQHKRINELTIAKLEAEVALMQAQVKMRADDEDRMQAAREFHELTVEKTKLEIDSLRLHLAEQRKRLDEFGLGG